MSRITRKELKSDQFALEVEHGITFFEQHKNEAAKYGAILVGVVVLIAGYTWYSRSQHATRQEALTQAIKTQEAPIGQSATGGMAFLTQEAKDAETTRVFTEVATKYSGSDEGEVAQYYLGAIKADQGKLAEAEKLFQEVAQKADKNYASLAKLSLAQIFFADGRADQGEKTLRDLIENPTVFVSSDQARITLARFLAPKKPAEARKLLEPLRTRADSAGQVALSLLAEIPQQ